MDCRRVVGLVGALAVLLVAAAPASASTVSNLTVANGSPSNAAGARTQYVATFDTSAAGALGSGGTVDVTFPADTTFGSFGSGGVFVGTARVGNCPTPNVTTLKTTCSIFGAVGASSTARVELNGVTNPTGPGGYQLTVATSADMTPVTSATYNVAAPNTLGAITVANASPSNAAGARTQYVASFTTTATGGLSNTGTSTIDVTFPAGTTFASFGSGGVFVGTTRVGNCPTPNGTTRKTTCSIFASVGASTAARLEFNGVTNPSTPGNYQVTVATSSDTTPTASQNYAVAAGNALTNVAVTPASTAESATTKYVVGFTTSPTGGLSSTGTSTIDVTFPAGTTFANYNSGGVFAGSTRIGNCPTPNATTRRTTCGIFGSVGASTNARLELNGVTNPTTPGNYQLTAFTSSDTSAVTSGQYGVAVDTVAPETAVVSGPAGTTTNPRPTFAFSSSEPGSSFRCSLDAAAFAACTSPFVTPLLSPGVHTFRVIAQDPAGNSDATPAVQTFTVTTTAPGPGPPPTPAAGKTVVVSEVAGTVRVRLKGSSEFVALSAAQGIPLGSTVDTTHGTVELTSERKAGGASQSARFFKGIFRVSQQGPVVNLKLTEKLAKCTAGKASAASKKKRKRKRRLWGDGKGRFRTKGQFSSATVRGTKWLVQDSCAGTLTKVARGVVTVRDNVKHKTIRVKAGKHYLAKRPR
jgi:hypothetical protein